MSNPAGCLRVLIVIDSLSAGGAETSTVAMLPHLVERGFEVEVATLQARPGQHDEVAAAGVVMHDLSGRGGRLGWFLRLRRLIGARDPDLVHTSLFESDVCGRSAAFSRRVPVVSTLATERYGLAHRSAPDLKQVKVRAAQIVDMATARMARRLHAVSTHVADTMAENLRYQRRRIDVVHRGRSQSLAMPAATKADPELAELVAGRRVLLMLARQDEAKGIDRALAAIPKILAAEPTAILLVAGSEGAHSRTLRAMIDELELGDSVRLLGHRTDVRALLDHSDIFLLPSRREGLPGSLLEAMAAGIPAVVNDLPQINEVVSSAEATIVDASDSGALADAVVDVLGHSIEADVRANLARNRFLDRFTIERSADGMADFYRRAVAGPRPGPDTSVRRWRPRFSPTAVKRTLDLSVALTAIIVLSPVLLTVALLILLIDGRPILFEQQRSGHHGRPFRVRKFRTMSIGSEDPTTDARRITSLGARLRATSLDELPNLFNVLRGEMSLVGPRPLPVQYLDRYSPEQRRRLEVRPGITGLAQVRGRNQVSWEDRFRLDIEYVDNWSLRGDLRLLVETVRSVLRREGIDASDTVTMSEFRGSASADRAADG